MNQIIHKIVATEVVVPARAGYVDRPAFGASLFDKHPKWIVEMFTNDGLVGCGETPRAISEHNLRWAAQQVLGKPLRTLSWQSPVPPLASSHDGYGHSNPPVPYRFHEVDLRCSESLAIEVAVLDLLGKEFQAPANALLGGAHREWVKTSWWFGRSDAEHAKRHMEIGLRSGFNAVKFKTTVDDDVVGIVRAIKEVAGPQTPVVVDANHRLYRLSDTLPIARRLEEFENVVLEDPFPFDAKEWQLFRQKSRLPIAFHCGGPAQFTAALREHCCDAVNISYPAGSFLGDAHMAWRCGLNCWHGSGAELGILDAYILHCSAAARNCVLPGDAQGHFIRCDDLVVGEFVTRDGAIQVPQGIGLGVILDRVALRRFARQQWEMVV